MKRHVTPTVAAIAALALLAGCSGSGSSDPGDSPSTEELTVWMMTGGPGDSPDLMEQVNAAFAETHPDVKVKIEIQQWADITTKLTTALAQENPPDIVEIGNTQVSFFAYSGALADLTADKGSFEGSDEWLDGLVGPATYDGKLFATPLYGGTKVVMYNKAMFDAAGIAAAPTTLDELAGICETLAGANTSTPNFSPFYMPGKFWYAATPFVWGAGGDIATQDGATWTGQMSSPESQQGLEQWRKFQNDCSTPSSTGLDTDQPDQIQVFADGQAAMLYVRAKEPATVLEANPEMEGNLGFFVFPGTEADSPLPVIVTGSDIAIAAKSPNQQVAKEWLQVMTSQPIQNTMAIDYNLLPVVPSFVEESELTDQQQVALAAGSNSKSVPASPGWTTLEADASLSEFYSSIAAGNDIAKAATDFDNHADDVLNALGQ